MVLLAVSSVLIGIIIGSSGVGGVLVIPALMFFGGLGTHEAMATALLTFFFGGIAATWGFRRHGSIDWKLTVPVCAGSLVTAYIGATIGAYASPLQLNLLLAGVIFASSIYSLFPVHGASIAGRLGPRGTLALLLGIGLFTGLLCGMTGAGGGIISLPVMLLFGFPVLSSIAVGQVLQMVIAFSGSVSNVANNFVDFSVVWTVSGCEVVGVLAGVRIAHAIPTSGLKRISIGLCLFSGVLIIWRAL